MYAAAPPQAFRASQDSKDAQDPRESQSAPPPRAPALLRSTRLEFPPHDPAASGEIDGVAGFERAVYHRDLVRPFGIELDESALEKGGWSYGEIGRALIEATLLADNRADQPADPPVPVDLLVLAYAVPDLEPGRASATYLSHVCPGHPMAFAVSDQGPAAAVTGLRLIREYMRSGGVRSALLLWVEQPVLPYSTGPLPSPMPAAASGVALLFGFPSEPAEPSALIGACIETLSTTGAWP